MKHLKVFNESKNIKTKDKLAMFGIDKEEFDRIFQDLKDEEYSIKIQNIVHRDSNDRFYQTAPKFLDTWTINLTLKVVDNNYKNDGNQHFRKESNILMVLSQALHRLRAACDCTLKFSISNSEILLQKEIKNNNIVGEVNGIITPQSAIINLLKTCQTDMKRIWRFMKNELGRGFPFGRSEASEWMDLYTIHPISFGNNLFDLDICYNSSKSKEMLASLRKKSTPFWSSDQKTNVHHFNPIINTYVELMKITHEDGDVPWNLNKDLGDFPLQLLRVNATIPEEDIKIEITPGKGFKVCLDYIEENEYSVLSKPKGNFIQKLIRPNTRDNYTLFNLRITVKAYGFD